VHPAVGLERLDEGRLRGLETHLFVPGLPADFLGMESRAVLGAGDAYELPTSRGHGYLNSMSTNLVRFKAAYVSGPTGPGVSNSSRSPRSAARCCPSGPPGSQPPKPPLQPVVSTEPDLALEVGLGERTSDGRDCAPAEGPGSAGAPRCGCHR